MYEELARVMDHNSEVIDRHLRNVSNVLRHNKEVLKNHKLHIEALDGTVKRLVKANRNLTTLAIIGIIFAFVAEARLKEQNDKIDSLTEEVEELKHMKGE